MADTHHASPTATVAPPNTHGAHDDAAHVTAHVRKYLLVGVMLVVLTGVTVWLSYCNFGSRHNNFIVAMIVATFKAGTVAAIFMHLKEEKRTIWRFLIFTVVFVMGLFFLTLLHQQDPIIGTNYNHHG